MILMLIDIYADLMIKKTTTTITSWQWNIYHGGGGGEFRILFWNIYSHKVVACLRQEHNKSN